MKSEKSEEDLRKINSAKKVKKWQKILNSEGNVYNNVDIIKNEAEMMLQMLVSL